MYQYNTEISMPLSIEVEVLRADPSTGFLEQVNIKAKYNGKVIELSDEDEQRIIEELKQFTAEDF